MTCVAKISPNVYPTAAMRDPTVTRPVLTSQPPKAYSVINDAYTHPRLATSRLARAPAIANPAVRACKQNTTSF